MAKDKKTVASYVRTTTVKATKLPKTAIVRGYKRKAK